MFDYNQKYNEYLQIVNGELENTFRRLKNCDEKLKKSMEYSVFAGGKRIRPVLMLAVADMLGVKKETALPFAISLELIHTSSLVHDDLPCVDNDDYRRGRLSNHKVFGEGFATFCGDALLNLAMENAIANVNDKNGILATKFTFDCSGYSGMLGGQAIDLNCNAYKKDESTYYEIITKKTAKLITVATVVPSLLCGGTFYDNMLAYGENLGVLFQITDDILDVTSTKESLGKTPNKDEIQNKLTAVTLYGLENAKMIEAKMAQKCKNAVKDIKNNQFLVQLVEEMVGRKK